jgi:hypothetical protein
MNFIGVEDVKGVKDVKAATHADDVKADERPDFFMSLTPFTSLRIH